MSIDTSLAPALDAAFFGASPVLRLRWLVRLRWVALGAVIVGLCVAALLRLPFVSAPPVIAAVAVGAIYNLWFTLRLQRAGARPFPFELQLHAVADVGALTLLLLSCGGIRNPICMFYGFHVVLGAMLGFIPGALLSAGVGGCGVLLVALAERAGLLLSPPLTAPPPWLFVAAASLNILGLGYFALGALRILRQEQDRAVRSSRLLLTGLDTLHVGMELVGPDGRLLLRNRQAEAIHPCPDGQWRPPPGLPEDLGRPGRPESERPGPYRFAHADPERGEPRIYEIVPLSGWDARLLAFLYVDRTESTVDEQRAIMLERLASLGRAMQSVAHELNTPLSSIQTLAVDLSHGEHGPDEAESISLIIDEARRCGEITREILASARPQEAQRSLRVHTLLRDVVRRAVRLTYGSKSGLTGVTVTGDLNASCVTDSDRLLQILVNLLQNARDASAAAAGDRGVQVTLSQGPAGAAVEVRDHGPGLPAEVRARLFTPFLTTKPPGQGTGLGLYTCARIARQLEAELTIADAPSGGVVARLVLPCSSNASKIGAEEAISP
jgi:signal transduction histidine kinase